ncbi:NlpC/P60 family protein [Aliiroseovarius sp.]|uniref:NlpC/P60 family protein n=1 Tax=Aliiroseovarius sp. TaxID=1872442 RepID=UPI0026070F92|nr:NlpC/P60 family protein [Aliiroseovarius sp.]
MTDRGHVLAEAARGWIGTPYRHQASVRGAGTDCLGLVRGVWREVLGGEPQEVPPYTADWSEPSREETLWTAARSHMSEKPVGERATGDVILFRMRDRSVAKHLGIVGRTGPHPTFIHAYSGHGVVESPLSAPWARRIVACFAFPKGI